MKAAGQRLVIAVVLLVACLPAQSASAAGPPLPSSATGAAGVVAPGGDERIVTRGAAADQTFLAAVRRSDGKELRTGLIDGRWRIAPAAFDGANTGLSADGRVLVIPRPERAFPPPETRLAVVNARQLTVLRTITLPGFFTLDAISPDGRWAYLIQYAGQNVLDYRVRALDTRTGRLAARDVLDPRDPDEQMGGLPMTRTMSRDGRWAYTLYSGGEETFIHALDTVGRTAACIDLPMLGLVDDVSLVEMRLTDNGLRLRVSNAGSVVAIVDTGTFAVREPGEPFSAEPAETEAAAAPPRRAVARAGDDGGFPWLVLPLAVVAGGLLLLTRRRRGRAPA